MAQSGAPIDLLFRIGVRSVNGLPNGATTAGGGPQDASEGFRKLMRALREVQSAGAVTLRFQREPTGGPVHLLLDGDDERAKAAARRVRQLLGIRPEVPEFEVVYGRGRRGPNQVAVLTRSVLQILYELASQMEVPEADTRRGDTLATEAGAPADPRERLIQVRHGGSAPRDAYAAVEYRGRWFWIDAADYRSKASFAFVYILQTLAESSHGQPTPVVTIPSQ